MWHAIQGQIENEVVVIPALSQQPHSLWLYCYILTGIPPMTGKCGAGKKTFETQITSDFGQFVLVLNQTFF